MKRHFAEKVSTGTDWGAFTMKETIPPRDPDEEDDEEEDEENEEEDRRVDEPPVVREPDEN
jgi:hypothetical protein